MSDFKPVNLRYQLKSFADGYAIDTKDVLDELANLRERLVHDGHTKACFNSRHMDGTACNCGAEDVWEKLREAIK